MTGPQGTTSEATAITQMKEMMEQMQQQLTSLRVENQQFKQRAEEAERRVAEHRTAQQEDEEQRRLEEERSSAQAERLREIEAARARLREMEEAASSQDLLDGTNRSDSSARPREERLPFAFTMDQLPKFSAEDSAQTVKSWADRIEEEAKLYAWTAEETFLAAKRALTGTARRWLESQRGLLSWKNMRESL